ncbi:hypothetical protein [Spiroplasma turonicum]|nr:hypothetical protein [Spiroplasma turonicum]
MASKVINNVDKMDFKIGNNSFSFDRTKLNENKYSQKSANWASVI